MKRNIEVLRGTQFNDYIVIDEADMNEVLSVNDYLTKAIFLNLNGNADTLKFENEIEINPSDMRDLYLDYVRKNYSRVYDKYFKDIIGNVLSVDRFESSEREIHVNLKGDEEKTEKRMLLKGILGDRQANEIYDEVENMINELIKYKPGTEEYKKALYELRKYRQVVYLLYPDLQTDMSEFSVKQAQKK